MAFRVRYIVSVAAVLLMSTGCGGDSTGAQANASDESYNVGEHDDVGVDADDSSEPAAPTEVMASQGESAEWVRISWAAVDDAQGYEVLRDGQVISGVLEGSESEFVDEEAGAPSEPGAPYDLEATNDRGAGVLLTWSFDEPEVGATHQYIVRALFEDDLELSSEPAEGYRGSYPVFFSMRADDGSWIEMGSEYEYLHEDAPYGELLAAGRVQATKGAYTDRVQLRIDGLDATVGEEVSYEVRSEDDHHDPQVSESVSGRRGIATPLYQWQRSAGDSPQGFEDIAGTSAPYGDMTAPEDGTIRYWRAQVNYPGEPASLTEPGWGWRAAECATDTQFFGQVSRVNDNENLQIELTQDPLTQDANLQALWDATVPAANWEDPQVLAPPVVVSEATVIATSFIEDQQFWLQDADSTMQVYLEEALLDEIRVGQQVSFTATEMSVFNGNPQVKSLTGFTVVTEENPVSYIDLRTDEVQIEEHYYRMVRLGGRLGPATPCTGDYSCYELTYGPTGGEQTVSYRSSDDTVQEGSCVTFLGPVIGYRGPKYNDQQETPQPQLQTDHFSWRVVGQ